MVRALFIAASVRYCLGALHHQTATEGADVAGRARLDRVFTLRIV